MFKLDNIIVCVPTLLWLVLLSVSVVLVLGACSPEKKSDEIIQKTIAGKKLCIPASYLNRGDDPSTETLLLTVMYPDMSPQIKTWKELKETNEYYKRIGLMLSPKTHKDSMKKIVEGQLKSPVLPPVVGALDSLVHRTHPKDYNGAALDLYMDEISYASVISCTMKETDFDVPQCTQNFDDNDLMYRASYEKKILNEQNSIREKILFFINSLTCQ
ncbi:MAG: hypothetical protein CMH30_04640 [Micavibrio sp.]|nr:hypothetical protein [Micavibrio sp.]